MGKFLLSTLLLLTTAFASTAETLEITPSDFNRNDGAYVNTAFSFEKNGFTFKVNNVNPTSGQTQANKAVASAFYIYNETAINKISKIEMIFSSVGTKTPNNAYFSIGSDVYSSTINSSDINGTWDSTSKIATWDCSNITNNYFSLNSATL